MATMGERIEQERQRLGWSAKQLADRVVELGGEITQQGIDRLEKRASTKSGSSVFIARALGVNHDWLTTGKGQRDLLRSIDHKMELLSPDDFDDLYKDFARAKAGERYDAFVTALGRRLAKGPKLLQEIAEDAGEPPYSREDKNPTA